eukprot:GEMP01112328.1.p1 GENE.GEMP01112328.1~~GEMP01112328.1.p1  ORF type:complete len:102 (+),score=0.44 GEMP01112328.1:110-415(+)
MQKIRFCVAHTHSGVNIYTRKGQHILYLFNTNIKKKPQKEAFFFPPHSIAVSLPLILQVFYFLTRRQPSVPLSTVPPPPVHTAWFQFIVSFLSFFCVAVYM